MMVYNDKTGSDIIFPICFVCRHLDISHLDEQSLAKCKAFPHKIPVEIATNKFDHRLPHPDDGGVQFEKLNDFSKLPEIFSHRSSEEINSMLEFTFKLLKDRQTEGNS